MKFTEINPETEWIRYKKTLDTVVKELKKRK